MKKEGGWAKYQKILAMIVMCGAVLWRLHEYSHVDEALIMRTTQEIAINNQADIKELADDIRKHDVSIARLETRVSLK